MQELEGLGDLVVDLEDGGDRQQYQEREVDEGVHEAGGRFAQQRLHVDAGPEVAEAALGVVGVGGPVVGGAALPVLHAVGEQDGAVDDQHGNDRVEGHLQGVGDVPEDLAGDFGVVVPAVDRGGDA